MPDINITMRLYYLLLIFFSCICLFDFIFYSRGLYEIGHFKVGSPKKGMSGRGGVRAV